MNKFSLGQVVRTIKGSIEQIEGPVMQIIIPTGDLLLLWGGDSATHYLIRDSHTGEYLSVIERGLEKV